MNPDLTHIGIDNGLDGGLCALNPDGSVRAMRPMPVYKRAGKREVDPVALLDWLSGLGPLPLLHVTVEEPLKHARSSQAMRSMGISYGKIAGVCEVHMIRMESIQPQEWQRIFLDKGRGDTKARALAAARRLLPGQDWTHAKPRGKALLHDGMVDAFLIARHGRNKKM